MSADVWSYDLLLFSCYVMSMFATPWTVVHQAPLPSTVSWVCSNSRPLSWWCYLTISFLLPPSPFAFNLFQHQVFSSELTLSIKWPKFWSFSFGISLSSEYSGLISFSIDWFDLAVHGLKGLLQHLSCCFVAKLCPTLCNRVDCGLPGPFVYGISQAMQEWVTISFSRGSSWPRDWTTTTIKKHQFFSAQPSLWSNSHICARLLEKS